MLKSLTILNFILIEKAQIEFGAKLNVITGESGAGKSIILQAIAIICGHKVSSELVQKNKNEASLTAVFSAPPNLDLLTDFIIEDNEIIIRKIIKKNGTSKTYLNDQSITTSFLTKITEQLLERHGQNEQKNLISRTKQRKYVDSLISEDELFIKLKDKSKKINEIKQEITEITKLKDKGDFELGYLQQIKTDFNQLKPNENEFPQLNITYQKNKESTKQQQKLKQILNFFNGDNNLNQQLNQLAKTAQEIEGDFPYDKIIDKPLEQINIILDQVEENILNQLEQNNLSNDNENISERISEYKRLARKYQKNPEELFTYNQTVNERILYLEQLQERERKLKEDLKQVCQSYFNYANKLSMARKEQAKKLINIVSSHLTDLNFQNAKFEIKIEHNENHNFSMQGFDLVEFYFSANKGIEAKLLSKIASGGEISRIMLALKLALKNSGQTILFDEIDAAIGGKTALMLAHKLQSLSDNNQVILITHQAIIAEKADHHLKVKKDNLSTYSLTQINKLNKLEKKLELERMLFGKEVD